MRQTTHQKQTKLKLFAPDESFMVSVMQGKYRKDMWAYSIGGKRVAVIYPDLPV